MALTKGFGGCSTIHSERRRLQLPSSVLGEDRITQDTKLYWTYDPTDFVPTVLTNLPPYAFDWGTTDMYGPKTPFSNSPQTVGIPGPYFDDYNGHNTRVPRPARLELGDKLFLVVEPLRNEWAIKCYRINQLARLDLSEVVRSHAQRARIVGCLGRREYETNRDAVNTILEKLPRLFE